MNWYKKAQERKQIWDDDNSERYLEMQEEARNDILREFYQANKAKKAKPNSQPWPVIPAARLIKIWNDYATLGIIRDERGLDEIVDRVLRNIARLEVNTELVGHTQINPEREYADDYESYGIRTQESREKLMDYIQDDKYSDYALKPLQNIAAQLMTAKTPEEKLLLVDQALNVIHQRGDIAAIFVEGGEKTLTYLFERGTKTAFNLTNKLFKKARDQFKCPVCGEEYKMQGKCLTAYHNPMTLEQLKNGHGFSCKNGHRWHGNLVYNPNEEK